MTSIPKTVLPLLTSFFTQVIILAEKPTAQRNKFGQNPEDTEKEMEELKTKLETLTSVPKKKYPFPMTANQEMGWDIDEVNEVTITRYRPLSNSDQSTTTEEKNKQEK